MQVVRTEEEKERAEQKQREAQKEREKVVKSVMSTPEGRKFVWGLLAETELFHGGYVADPNRLQWLCGRRDLGLKYFDEVNSVCPELFQLAQEENKPETDEVNNGR